MRAFEIEAEGLQVPNAIEYWSGGVADFAIVAYGYDG
jgi:hypothetical protein